MEAVIYPLIHGFRERGCVCAHVFGFVFDFSGSNEHWGHVYAPLSDGTPK